MTRRGMAQARPGRARAVGLLGAAAVLLAACGGGGTHRSGNDQLVGPTATDTSPAPPTGSGSGSAPAPSTGPVDTPAPRRPAPGPPAPTRSAGAPSGPLEVHFDQAVAPKQFGDPPFTVHAAATPGAAVAYTATGACAATAAVVRILHVGSCAVTATATSAGRPAAQAVLAIPVGPAHPVIQFAGVTASYSRTHGIALGATSTPPVPLVYRVVVGGAGTFNDSHCQVAGSTLVMTPGFTLTAACLVEVSAAPSGDYAPPAAVDALVHIGDPNWQVSVPPVGTVSWSHLTGGRLTVPVDESSGDAFSMSVFEGPDLCPGVSVVDVSPHAPSPAGTTRYTATVQLADPGAGSYGCSLEAQAGPVDYAGGTPSADVSFSVTP